MMTRSWLITLKPTGWSLSPPPDGVKASEKSTTSDQDAIPVNLPPITAPYQPGRRLLQGWFRPHLQQLRLQEIPGAFLANEQLPARRWRCVPELPLDIASAHYFPPVFLPTSSLRSGRDHPFVSAGATYPDHS